MAFPLIELDTVYPPTWDGTPVDVPEVIDGDSGLRATVREDPVNYFPMQRSQGDLFHRDLLLLKGIKDLLAYLRAYNGLVFNTPAVAMAPDTEIDIATLLGDGFDEYYLVAMGAEAKLAAATANTGVKLRDGDDAVLATVTTVQRVKFVIGTESAGELPEDMAVARAVLFNADVTDRVLSGWVAAIPK